MDNCGCVLLIHVRFDLVEAHAERLEGNTAPLCNRLAVPVILSQRFIGDESSPKYKDVEGVIYHYPRVYFKRVVPDDRFVYYRPAKGSSAHDAGTYFGHGRLGLPYPDMLDNNLRFVDIKAFSYFPNSVPLRGVAGIWMETGSGASPQFQAAVRDLSLYDYHRLLIAGGVPLTDVESLPTIDDLYDGSISQLVMAPKDPLRQATSIPDGTGYVWSGGALPNLAESAALQERARADHQRVLRTIAQNVERKGGSWWFNNNIDLFARIGEQTLLIEAKSLTNPLRAVDRMRYGMGQLFDYRVRYEAEVAGAIPVLAFGTPPSRSDAWVANILDANGVAFVALRDNHVLALNPRAQHLAIIERE